MALNYSHKGYRDTNIQNVNFECNDGAYTHAHSAQDDSVFKLILYCNNSITAIEELLFIELMPIRIRCWDIGVNIIKLMHAYSTKLPSDDVQSLIFI